MRAIIFLLLVIVQVFGSEKDEVIKLVQNKFKEVENEYTNLMKTLKIETGKTDPEQEKQTKNELNKANLNALAELNTNVQNYTKTAIIKGKPLNAIECIAKLVLEGEQLIKDTTENFNKAIPEVLLTKREKLYLFSLESQLIKNAATELKDTTLKKLGEAEAPLETLKNNILKQFETAIQQYVEIENQIPKPTLAESYVALKRLLQASFNNIKDDLLKKLEKCVA